jgi:hypothetical protein
MVEMLTHTRSMLDGDGIRAYVGEARLAQFFVWAMKRAGQMRCAITGHNALLRYEPKRLSLQCATCGYESPGWELSREPGPNRAHRPYSGAPPFSPPVTV